MEPLPGQLTQQSKEQLQAQLLAWFRQNGRTFPWREENDPYLILVAEKLLQQTSARELVVVAYQELVQDYPTPAKLAAADEGSIRKTIKSLGFHYRAGELVAMARAVGESFGGEIPNTLEELKSLPGVGNYIARAVLSFAYKHNIAVVDINVARILNRVFALPDSVLKNSANNKLLQTLADELIPTGSSRQFNLAMLDLGALVCLKRNPRCAACPIHTGCHYYGGVSSLG